MISQLDIDGHTQCGMGAVEEMLAAAPQCIDCRGLIEEVRLQEALKRGEPVYRCAGCETHKRKAIDNPKLRRAVGS